jgi:hypothetical protein
MDSIDQTKPNTEQAEIVKPGPLHQLPLPAELESLESHELEKLEKGLVRRLDSCLLPAVVILFLMNILDRLVYYSWLWRKFLTFLGTILQMQRSPAYPRPWE